MRRRPPKTPFHDYGHARDFDQRAARSEFRVRLGAWLTAALELEGDEWILDIATGTGRFARPVAGHLKGGKIVGLDEALAMLRVAREQAEKEPIPGYLRAAGVAEALPFREGVFDRAFVALSLHHFGDPPRMVRETRRVLRSGGKLVVLDPVLLEPKDSLDRALHELINRIFRRSHGDDFRFHTAGEIRDLVAGEGFQIARADLHRLSFDQENMEGIPTGRHWLEVAAEMRGEAPEMRARFEQSYLRYGEAGPKPRFTGTLSFSLVCGTKR